MKQARAAEIADKLNDTKRWNSHARPISMEVARNDLNLKIEDYSAIPDLGPHIKCYYRLLRDYMAKTRNNWAIHTLGSYKAFGG